MKENEMILMALADSMFNRGYNNDYNDSITYEDIFEKNLLQVLSFPNSFDYTFSALTKHNFEYDPWRIHIIYSDDSLFRIFNWLSPSSGTWECFPVIFQAKTKDRSTLYLKPTFGEGSQPSTSYESIYRIRSKTGQLYLCIGHGQLSSSLPFEMVEAYEVSRDTIIGARILQETAGLSSEIFVDRQSTFYGDSSQDIPFIEYNKRLQSLTIPEIKGNYELTENVKWTGKYIHLKFNGKLFLKL